MKGVTHALCRSGRIPGSQETIFWLTAVLFMFIFLGSSPLGSSEISWAEAAREMLITGNYWHTAVNWQLRFDKGVLNCWLALPFIKLFGCSEIAVRMPAALAALASLAALKLMAKKIFSPRVALLAGWMLLGCWSFLFTGRAASADMTGMAAATWCAAWFFLEEDKSSFIFYLIFYLFCAAGVLCGGLIILIMPLATILPTLFSRQGKKHWNWKNLLSFLITAGAATTFFWLISEIKPAAGQQGVPELQKILKALIEFEKENSWYSLLTNLFRVLLPWTPFLAAGIAGIIANWKTVPAPLKRTFIGIAAGTLLLQLWPLTQMEPARWNSVTSAVPFLILAGAGGLSGYGIPAWNRTAFTFLYYSGMTAAALCIGSILAWPLWQDLAEYDPDPVLIIAPVAAGFIAWYALFLDHRRNSTFSFFIGLPHRTGSSLFALTILSGTFFSVLMPVIQMDFRTGKKFCLELQHKSKNLLAGETYHIASSSGEAAVEYLFYTGAGKMICPAGDLLHIAAAMPGEQLLFLLKKSQQEQFIAQAGKLGIKLSLPLLTERHHRWNSTGSSGGFTAYLIKLPHRNKK